MHAKLLDALFALTLLTLRSSLYSAAAVALRAGSSPGHHSMLQVLSHLRPEGPQKKKRNRNPRTVLSRLTLANIWGRDQAHLDQSAEGKLSLSMSESAARKSRGIRKGISCHTDRMVFMAFMQLMLEFTLLHRFKNNGWPIIQRKLILNWSNCDG